MYLGLAPIRAKRARFMANRFKAPAQQELPTPTYGGDPFMEARRIFQAGIEDFSLGKAVSFLRAVDQNLSPRNYASSDAFNAVAAQVDMLLIRCPRGTTFRNVLDWSNRVQKQDAIVRAKKVLSEYVRG